MRSNYALDGYAGNLLGQYCKEQGLHLDDFWRTCLIKEEIPKDATEEQLGNLVSTYGPILNNEINDLSPNLLIPLGEQSFRYFTNLTSIRKFRGSVLPLSGNFALTRSNLKVLPILGPNPYLNQEYKLRPITRIDFGKIPKHLTDCPIPDNLYSIWVARSSSALREFIQRHYDRTIKEGGFLTFDIETYFQIPICISFCFDGFESVCVPLVDSSIDRDNRTLMMELVAKLLASPIPKVNQNIKYDWKIMERWQFYVNNIVGDTMLAASTLYCEFPKNLGFLTSIYTDLPYFKDEGKEFDPDKGKRDRYYLYNAKDSLATSQIYNKQRDETKELGVDYVYKSLMQCLPVYKKMEQRGLRIDQEQQLKLLLKYESLFHIQEIKLRKLIGRPYFNPISHKQCHDLLFNELGYTKVKGMKVTQSGQTSTDEDSLDLLAAYGNAKRAPNTGPPVLEAIIGARKIHKVIEILELPLHPDGRFRCEFNLAGTENARTSAGKTTDQYLMLDDSGYKLVKSAKGGFPNYGHSLQTIGKHGFSIDGRTYGQDIRSMFVPSPGMVFLEADLKSAEAMVDRVLCGLFDMDIFNDPGIHKLTGSWAYDCDPYEIKKNVLVDGVDRYHVAKQIRHSGERNIQAESLRVKFLPELPLFECVRLLKVLHEKQPEIKEVFHHDVIAALDAPSHCLVAPNGRRRDFFDRIDRGTYNEGFSFLPQAIVTDQTKFQGILPTSEATKDGWAHLLTEQHDGVLYEVQKDRAMDLARIYKSNVEAPIDFRTCSLSRDYRLTIPCEVSIGESWYEMKEVQID